MRTIGLIRQDNKNNMVYETQNLLQCMFLSFARVVCTHCKNIERKQYFVARADRFARRWPFRNAVTVSGGGDCFALLYCTWWWPVYMQKDKVSVLVRHNLIRRSYCPQKGGVSVSVCENLIQRSYCLRKDQVSVSVCDNIIPSSHCTWGDQVYLLHAAL